MATGQESAPPSAVATDRQPPSKVVLLLAALLPLALLMGLILVFALRGNDLVGTAPAPIEQLEIQRLTFDEGRITASVLNSGPDEVTISQALVNEAIWDFSIEPGPTLGRLERATVTFQYPWVEAEPVAVTLISATGLRFSHEVGVPTITPAPGAASFFTYAVLGVYAGVIPVFLGLLWYPFLRRIGRGWMSFFLSLTAGLLIFLGVDTVHEALETAGTVPGAFQGVSLVAAGIVLTFLAITVLNVSLGSRGGNEAGRRLTLAYTIALGIGLHNLGEGLAIGAAYVLGEVALGAFLVIGFTLHNITEGLGIVAPIARDRPGLKHLVILGVLAGGPTVIGTWIGGFIYSPVWATLFLAIGAGAIFQVVYELGRMLVRDMASPRLQLAHYAGLVVGIAIMYLTGLLVKF
jgi:ZIP family zinc transporter